MSQEDHFQAPALEHLAELLPAFEIEAFIAKGGMGAVYLARQRSLDRQVAIKVLPRELGADPEFRASFETEAKAMARLNHPNLIGVFDYGDVDGMPYIVMEYVDGNSLYHSAWGQTVDPEQAVSLVRRICEGLGHAHEHGIIHRDIKPANILLNSKAEPKIGDFGLAIPTDSDGPGLVMGTPGYSAPEFLQNPAASDHRADIYAVGVILHELLTAERPDPEYQAAFKPCGDPKLDAIWKKAVAPDPAQRYQNCEAMAADLAAWKPSPASRLITSAAAGPRVPRPAAPTTTARPVVTPARPVAGAAAPRSTVVPPKKSTTGRNLAFILILLAAIGVAYVLLNKETAKRDAHNDNVSDTNTANREAAERELERQRAKAEAERLATANAGNDATIDTHPDESPGESLARLQERLRHGFRSELPKGSIRHGDADFLLIEDPMTWSAASLFAEEHGAFLDSPADDTELSWLSQLAPAESPIWIGGGRSSDDRWIMVDRTDWPLGKQPTGVGNYASTDNLGILRARPGATKLPFVIQWLRDGSNPGSLEGILQRTRESLADPSPAFPPGTLSQDVRRFCFIERPVTLDQAKALCEAAGGHLAAPASNDEAMWIQNRIKNRAGERYWIGGEFDGSSWRWSTREAWPSSDWPSGAQTGDTAVVLVRDDGWVAANPSQPADGFIIEWSDDHKKAGRGTQGIIFQRDDLKELHLKAIQLIAEADGKRNSELAENAKKLVWNLQTWFGRLGAADSARWKPHVDALIDQIQEDPAHHCPKPTEFGKDSDISLSAEMMEFVEAAYLEELEIRSRYRTSVIRIRDAYATRLNEAAVEADKKGEDAAANAIRQAAESTKNLDDWLEGMKEG